MADGRFTVDARALLTLGRDSIKDPVTAVLELVKNSYDADARCVEVGLTTTKPTQIRVSDNGVGMTRSVVDDQWLRIGFSSKRKATTTKLSRRATGEKGIGRLSADRLGSVLELRTQSDPQSPVTLKVDWSRFDRDGVDLGSIVLPYTVPEVAPLLPKHKTTKKSGTELIITDLRQVWTRDDVEHLQRELTILRPPTSTGDVFDITFTNDVDPGLNGVVPSSFEGKAEIRIEATLHTDGKVESRFFTRNTKGDTKELPVDDASWKEFTQDKNEFVGIGIIRVTLDFLPRKAEVLRGTSLNIEQLRDFLNQYAGVRIYRDGVRVRPYGSDGDDWLGLGKRKIKNPAGRSRKAYKISPNQLVGSIDIGRDTTPKLVDSSAREGLVSNDAFACLKVFVLACVQKVETQYHLQSQEPPASSNGVGSVRTLIADLTATTEALRRLRADFKDGKDDAVQRALNDLPVLVRQLESATEAAEESASQAGVLRSLATIGIAAAVFGHETQSSLEMVRMSASLAAKLIIKKPPAIERAVEELAKTIESSDRVSAWGEFALSRLKRDKRRRKPEDINKLLSKLLDTLEPAIGSAEITVGRHIAPVHGRTFAIDIEAVAINLLTNAYTACQLGSDNRRIRFELKARKRDKRDGFEMIVSDTGPGVPPNIRELIWTPLYTTSPREGVRFGGTGLGLSIVQSIVVEHAGERAVDRDPQLKGARFTIWLPLG